MWSALELQWYPFRGTDNWINAVKMPLDIRIIICRSYVVSSVVKWYYMLLQLLLKPIFVRRHINKDISVKYHLQSNDHEMQVIDKKVLFPYLYT